MPKQVMDPLAGKRQAEFDRTLRQDIRSYMTTFPLSKSVKTEKQLAEYKRRLASRMVGEWLEQIYEEAFDELEDVVNEVWKARNKGRR